ncbi:secretory lipase-domain-containing protein [Aspergillus keveii]|uniref:Secretory lipase-domain-containing protein n=1 Tax=Aspergillus keveii TaxID=714993 RepID=A0ABR4FIN1_9EURO
MNYCFLLFSLLFLVPFLAAGAPTEQDGPLLPTEDPFYAPPSDYESKAPGTILRHRIPPFPIAALGFANVNIQASYQILYRSSDTWGRPIAAVSTVLVPHNADFNKVMSYQVAQDAADPNCAPFFALQKSSDAGWIVTVLDHLGPKSAFLANTLSGQVTLDGIRAILASGAFTYVSPHATVTMWGYSGGSLASGFAAELHPIYAPELKIAGAVLGGTVPKILPVIESVNKGFFAGLVPAGIQGLANEYPIAQTIIDGNLLPEKAADFNKTRSLCLTGNLLEYAGQDILTYLKDPDAFTSGPATVLLEANNMGHNIPKIPLLIYKSANDEISPIKDSDELYSHYCANGATVEYKRDKLSEHALLEITGAPDAFLWLVDRMNGKPLKKGCSKSTQLTGLANPRAITAFGIGIIRLLLSILSFPLGPPAF